MKEAGIAAGIHTFLNVRDERERLAGKRVADAVEAILGAVYRDGGVENAKKVMEVLGVTVLQQSKEAEQVPTPPTAQNDKVSVLAQPVPPQNADGPKAEKHMDPAGKTEPLTSGRTSLTLPSTLPACQTGLKTQTEPGSKKRHRRRRFAKAMLRASRAAASEKANTITEPTLVKEEAKPAGEAAASPTIMVARDKTLAAAVVDSPTDSHMYDLKTPGSAGVTSDPKIAAPDLETESGRRSSLPLDQFEVSRNMATIRMSGCQFGLSHFGTKTTTDLWGDLTVPKVPSDREQPLKFGYTTAAGKMTSRWPFASAIDILTVKRQAPSKDSISKPGHLEQELREKLKRRMPLLKRRYLETPLVEVENHKSKPHNVHLHKVRTSRVKKCGYWAAIRQYLRSVSARAFLTRAGASVVARRQKKLVDTSTMCFFVRSS